MEDEIENAFERFCIMTVEGGLSDEDAYQQIIRKFGREVFCGLVKKTLSDKKKNKSSFYSES